MEEILYSYDGDNLTKEEYLQKIGFAGYEDIFEEIIAKKTEYRNNNMFLIQLFDNRC